MALLLGKKVAPDSFGWQGVLSPFPISTLEMSGTPSCQGLININVCPSVTCRDLSSGVPTPAEKIPRGRQPK